MRYKHEYKKKQTTNNKSTTTTQCSSLDKVREPVPGAALARVVSPT